MPALPDALTFELTDRAKAENKATADWLCDLPYLNACAKRNKEVFHACVGEMETQQRRLKNDLLGCLLLGVGIIQLPL